MTTEAQIAHIEANQVLFDEHQTMPTNVRDYFHDYADIPDLYERVCADLGLTPEATS